MLHSIRFSRIEPFQPPHPSRYDVLPRRTPIAACLSIYPMFLNLQKLLQEYGLPSKGHAHLFSESSPTINRTVQGIYWWSLDPGLPKYHLWAVSSSPLAPLVDQERSSGTT